MDEINHRNLADVYDSVGGVDWGILCSDLATNSGERKELRHWSLGLTSNHHNAGVWIVQYRAIFDSEAVDMVSKFWERSMYQFPSS
jgi:hypothetical protein